MAKPDGAKPDRSLVPERIASGEFGDVWLCGNALREYRALQNRAEANADETSVREERTLSRYFEWYAEGGPGRLGNKMYKPQSREKVGQGKTVHIFEFKAYQFRIYGAEGTLRGKRAFIGTECDAAKKQDKADRKVLARAAQKFSEVELDGKGKKKRG